MRKRSPEGGGHEAECQQGRWAPKAGGFGKGSHIDRRKGRVPARTLGPEGEMDCEHIDWGGE